MMLKELEAIPLLLDGLNPKELKIARLRTNKLSASYNEKNSWLKSVAEVATFLNDLGVEYVLVKYIDIPYASMQDIDLLIENEESRHTLFSVLRKNGYTSCRSLFSPHPEKVEFTKFDHYFEIDIYPEPAWWKITYAPAGLISSAKILKNVSGTEVFLPTATHDIYIVITHSYAHGTITLAELAHVAKTILNNQINWPHLTSLAKHYHFEHAVYIYLFLIGKVLMSMGYDNYELRKVLNELSHNFLSRRLRDTLLRNCSSKFFPIRIPLSFRFLSGFHEPLLLLTSGKNPTTRELSTYWLLVQQKCSSFSKEII